MIFNLIGILVLIFICVTTQGFFSGSEMAMVSADRIALQTRANSGHAGASLALRMLEREDSLLGTCLIGTNVCVVTGTTLVAYLLLQFDIRIGLVTAAVFAPLALIFGENLPKTVFQHHANRLAPVIAPPLRCAQVLFWPALLVVRGWSNFLSLFTRTAAAAGVTRQEIVELLEMSSGEEIDAEEKRFIKGVFAISETQVGECMTPLVHVVGVPVDASVSTATEITVESGFSRLPAYRDRVDNIVGVLHVQDLLFGLSADEPVKTLVDEIKYVPESKRVDDMLHEMRRERVHIAVVVDEYGGSTGIVTIEDLLEEIIGDIRDERDLDAPNILRLGEREWRIPGQVEMEDLASVTGATFPDGDFETVAGFILDAVGRIPTSGETIQIDGLVFTIEECTERAIGTVRLILPWHQ